MANDDTPRGMQPAERVVGDVSDDAPPPGGLKAFPPVLGDAVPPAPGINGVLGDPERAGEVGDPPGPAFDEVTDARRVLPSRSAARARIRDHGQQVCIAHSCPSSTVRVPDPSRPGNMMTVRSDSPLRAARIAAGFRTAREFAVYANVNPTTYYHQENGRRMLSTDFAAHYARLLKVSPSQLLYGSRLPWGQSVPIVGLITAEGVKMAGPEDSVVVLPDLHQLESILVSGDELRPAYNDGDAVFFEPMQPRKFRLSTVHGRECVVMLADGSMMLRTVSAQANGLATLICTAPAYPPLLNQHILAASRVLMVLRAPIPDASSAPVQERAA